METVDRIQEKERAYPLIEVFAGATEFIQCAAHSAFNCSTDNPALSDFTSHFRSDGSDEVIVATNGDMNLKTAHHRRYPCPFCDASVNVSPGSKHRNRTSR